jgi:hypothetical protein
MIARGVLILAVATTAAALAGGCRGEHETAELAKLIGLGGAHAPDAETMPGWIYTITPDDRQALVAYLRTLPGTVEGD